MTLEGSSRDAWIHTLDVLTEVQSDRDLDLRSLAEELYTVSETLGANAHLSRALGDKSRDAWPKRELAQRLLGERISPAALTVVEAAVSGRWRIDRDLIHTLERCGQDCVLAAAQRDGNLDQVERELLEVQQLFSSDQGLRDALHRSDLADEVKAELVATLLTGRVLPDTVSLAQRPVLNARGRRYAAVIWRILTLAARRREMVTAIVTSAVPLDDEQVSRLAAGLTRLYDRKIFVNTTVDPSLVGGLRVRVDDEVIDATIERRLAEAGRVLGAV